MGGEGLEKGGGGKKKVVNFGMNHLPYFFAYQSTKSCPAFTTRLLDIIFCMFTNFVFSGHSMFC